jgi:hypothetical protein
MKGTACGASKSKVQVFICCSQCISYSPHFCIGITAGKVNTVLAGAGFYYQLCGAGVARANAYVYIAGVS